jgi:hypothetical protein
MIKSFVTQLLCMHCWSKASPHPILWAYNVYVCIKCGKKTSKHSRDGAPISYIEE